MPKKIAIVGAGVGGLAAAARLGSRGHEVDVFERLPLCGGRNNIIEDAGFKFDTGPSFVLMPDFFKEVFQYCGRDIKDYLDLKMLDVNYKIFYTDGDTLTVYNDSARTQQELERIERGAAAGYTKFIKETERIYRQVEPLLYKCFEKSALCDARYWMLIKKIRALESYWQLASRFFRSHKLRYAFTFEAMFIGVSPFQAPAFYSVITYADHVQKIFHPMGGMYRIPLALEKLAREFGVRFHYNEEVFDIVKPNGSIMVTTGKTHSHVDAAVVNADYAYTQSMLLKRTLPKYQYSCSTYLLYLGLNKKVTGLAHHNLFFAKDLKRNLRQIFRDGVIPDDPSFYVHVPTVTDPSLAPPGKDIVYVLVPVPNLQKQSDVFLKYERAIRSAVFQRVKEQAGVALEDSIETEHRFYPLDFIGKYNIQYGATFGLAHNLMQSAFFRPSNVDAQMKNLYFVGASTQPGGGLPVVIASSRIVADLISGGGIAAG